MRTERLLQLFQFCSENEISFALTHTYSSFAEMLQSRAIDIVIAKKDVIAVVDHLQKSNLITATSLNMGALHLCLYLSVREQLQLSLIYDIQFEGMRYAVLQEVLSSRISDQEWYTVGPQYEYFFLLLPTLFQPEKNHNRDRARQEYLYATYGAAIETIHTQIFGHAQKHSVRRFRWNHRAQLLRTSRYYAREMKKSIFQPYRRVVAFFGPDGAGKSSVLEQLMARDVAFSKTQSQTHLKPQHILKKRTQKRGIVTEPHKEEPRDSWSAGLKLLVYAQEYWIEYFLHPQRDSHLHIFDRYLHDTTIDSRRYRLAEGNMWAPIISQLAPQPVLFVILNADPEVIQSRKAEVPLEATRKQCESYLAFAKRYPEQCIVIDANQVLEAVVDDIIIGMAEKLSAQNQAVLQKALASL